MKLRSYPFTPSAPTTSFTAVTASTAIIAQTQSVGGVPVTNTSLRIYNSGPNDAFVEFVSSTSGTASTSTSMPISNGKTEVFTTRETCVAAIAGAGKTATLFITPGEGGN